MTRIGIPGALLYHQYYPFLQIVGRLSNDAVLV